MEVVGKRKTHLQVSLQTYFKAIQDVYPINDSNKFLTQKAGADNL
jgi:hypothetical protein